MSAQLKDLTRLQQPARPRTGLLKISYGVHHLEVAIAGKSVGEVRQALKEPLNIDPRALALVNGRDVAASYVLKEGDQLEFVRLAGEKGGGAGVRCQVPGARCQQRVLQNSLRALFCHSERSEESRISIRLRSFTWSRMTEKKQFCQSLSKNQVT